MKSFDDVLNTMAHDPYDMREMISNWKEMVIDTPKMVRFRFFDGRVIEIPNFAKAYEGRNSGVFSDGAPNGFGGYHRLRDGYDEKTAPHIGTQEWGLKDGENGTGYVTRINNHQIMNSLVTSHGTATVTPWRLQSDRVEGTGWRVSSSGAVGGNTAREWRAEIGTNRDGTRLRLGTPGFDLWGGVSEGSSNAWTARNADTTNRFAIQLDRTGLQVSDTTPNSPNGGKMGNFALTNNAVWGRGDVTEFADGETDGAVAPPDVWGLDASGVTCKYFKITGDAAEVKILNNNNSNLLSITPTSIEHPQFTITESGLEVTGTGNNDPVYEQLSAQVAELTNKVAELTNSVTEIVTPNIQQSAIWSVLGKIAFRTTDLNVSGSSHRYFWSNDTNRTDVTNRLEQMTSTIEPPDSSTRGAPNYYIGVHRNASQGSGDKWSSTIIIDPPSNIVWGKKQNLIDQLWLGDATGKLRTSESPKDYGILEIMITYDYSGRDGESRYSVPIAAKSLRPFMDTNGRKFIVLCLSNSLSGIVGSGSPGNSTDKQVGLTIKFSES